MLARDVMLPVLAFCALTINLLLCTKCVNCAINDGSKLVASNALFDEWFSALRKKESDDIKCILCDIDGTFVDSHRRFSEDTVQSIQALMKKGVKFFPATGRTRKSAAAATGDAFTRIFQRPIEEVPGVFAQGLTVYGEDGKVIFERFLEEDVIAIAEEFCEEHNLSLIAYSGDQIYYKKQSEFTDLIDDYCEPFPLQFPLGLTQLHLLETAAVSKVIILGDEERLLSLRSTAEAAFTNRASVTRAAPRMLEVLPAGASKGDGVLLLLQHCGLQPSEVIAFGDGENDIEMMRSVRFSVAVANAHPALKAVCKAVTLSNDEDGVGHVLKLLLQAKSSQETLAQQHL